MAQAEELIKLEQKGDVFILHMNAKENWIHPPFISQFHKALDIVERYRIIWLKKDRSSGPCSLITIGEGKFFSNGIVKLNAADRIASAKLIQVLTFSHHL